MRKLISHVFAAGLLLAQTSKTFEAVSVKPTNETLMSLIQSGKDPGKIDDAQAVIRVTPLSGLVAMAFNVPGDQVSGPDWMNQVRFDVSAKFPAGSTKRDLPEMMQAMLADRFKMTFHHDQKVRPVYFLQRGKGELKIQPTAGGDPNPCNGGRGGHHTCQNVSMEMFAQFLGAGRSFPQGPNSVWLDRPVVDKTGLTGAYDFSFDFGRVGARDRSDESAPIVEIPDAVRALGLILEPGKAPYDIVVIDHIERVPTEN